MSDTATTWIADLPEDLRADPTITSLKGPGGVDFKDWKEVGPVIAKSYVESRKLIGKKAYDLPSDNWKPEQWAEWNKTIGVPDAPDKYGAPTEEILTKAGLNKEVLASAQKRFHELGLTPRQVKGLMDDWYIPNAASGSETIAKQKSDEKEKTISALKTELGDKYEARVGLVKSVLQLGGGDLADRFEKAGFGNDPELFKALSSLGEKILEDSSRRGGLGATQLGPEAARADALRQIEEMKIARRNPAEDEKYRDPRSQERKKWLDLHAIAYKEQTA
jgi:hypothetical protein